MKKLPPKEKILEAYTAIGDHHVEITGDEANVISSDGAKKYTVKWKGDSYQSNDNATYWQGYPGYPIIAVLILQKRLPFDASLAHELAGVNWNEINQKFKRDYSAATKAVLNEKGLDVEKTLQKVDSWYEELTNLPLTVKRCGIKVENLKSSSK